MIAYESRKLMIARKTNGESNPSELFLALTRKATHMPHLFTPAILDQLQAADVKPIRGGSNGPSSPKFERFDVAAKKILRVSRKELNK